MANVLKRKLLKLATWNVRGLTSVHKQELLGEECARYEIDVEAVQETKIKDSDEKRLHTNHKLILLEQKTAAYRGLGFVIDKKW